MEKKKNTQIDVVQKDIILRNYEGEGGNDITNDVRCKSSSLHRRTRFITDANSGR